MLWACADLVTIADWRLLKMRVWAGIRIIEKLPQERPSCQKAAKKAGPYSAQDEYAVTPSHILPAAACACPESSYSLDLSASSMLRKGP